MGEEIKEKFEKAFGKEKESLVHETKESDKYPFEFVFEEEVGKHKRLL